jgi:hypothetical protein
MPADNPVPTVSHEEWRSIPGFEACQVSSWGRVRGVTGVILRQTKRGGGRRKHLAVSLCQEGHIEKRHVGELVLLAFVGPRPEGLVVSHENDDATNNRLDNLSWATHSQNAHLAVRNGKRRLGSLSKQAKLTEGDVREIVRRSAAGEGQHSLARAFGVTQPAVRYILLGHTWSHVTGIIGTRKSQADAARARRLRDAQQRRTA